MEDSETFDEQLRVETRSIRLRDMFGTLPTLRRVRVSDGALDIEQMLAVPHRKITNAFLVSDEAQLRVVVTHGLSGCWIVHVRSREEAERFLRAIHFSKTQRSTSFRVIAKARLAGGFLVSLWVAWMMVVITGANFYFLALAPIFATTFFFFARNRRGLLVGRDGVTISRFGRHRFISYGEIESVNRFADTYRGKSGRPRESFLGLVLHLKNQEHLSLPIMTKEARSYELDGAYELVSDALAEWRAKNPSDDAERLRRDSRSTKEWIASLKKMGSEHADYRVAPIERDALLAIAEDPANEAVSRAAAALVLRGHCTSEERARLEASAKTTANPRLRVALDHVIENQGDADLEAVLDDLDPSESKQRVAP